MRKRYLRPAIIIGILLLLGVGLGFLWQRLRVRPPVPPTPLPPLEITPTLPQPAVPSYSLRASLPTVKKLPVYEYRYDCPDSVCKARPSEWAGNLGFAGEPEEIKDALRGTLYLWSKPGQTLIVDQKASSLSYGVDLLADPQTLSGSFLPTFEQASAIVERTLLDLSPESKLLKFDPSKSEALAVGVARAHPATTGEADLVEIHFVAKVDDYPIYLESGPAADPVVAWVGKDGKLLRLEYHPVGNLGEKVDDYPLKDEEEVLEGLEGGEGIVVNSNLEAGQEIASVTITQTSLGYLLPQPDVTTLQPVFVLSGQARTEDGRTAAVTIYLPATR